MNFQNTSQYLSVLEQDTAKDTKVITRTKMTPEAQSKKIQEISDKIDRLMVDREEDQLKIQRLQKEVRKSQKIAKQLKTELYTVTVALTILVLSVITAFTIGYTKLNDAYAESMEALADTQAAVLQLNETISGLNAELVGIKEITSTIQETTESTGRAIEADQAQRAAIQAEKDRRASVNLTNIAEKSGATAEDFNQVINNVLTSKGYGTTQFSGMGEALADMEAEYNVNGFFLLGIATLESGYGTSTRANNKNDLYGLLGMSFDSIYDNTIYCGKLLRNSYINNGRTTIDQIRKKYCPSSSTWTGNVEWCMKQYTQAFAALE